MSEATLRRLARRIVALEARLNAQQTRQLPHAAVLLDDGTSAGISDTAGAAADALDLADFHDEQLDEIGDIGDSAVVDQTHIPDWLDSTHEVGDAVLGAVVSQNERIVDLAEARTALETASGELSERLDGAEVDLGDARSRLEGTETRLDSVAETADEALALAPLTAGELTAVVAELMEAFIGSAHIIDLDVEKLIVTGTSVLNEAVVQKLFAEVVTARFLEITEALIGKDGTFTGKLTVEHLDVETLFGTRIDGLQIYGGSFVQYSTGEFLPIYPSPASWVEVPDWSGGPPTALVAAVEDVGVKESGAASARVSRTNAGSLSAIWKNADRVAVRADAARKIEVRFRASQAMTGVHLIVGKIISVLGTVPANEWTTIQVELPEGAPIEWAHLGGQTSAATSLYVDRVTVLSADLVGAHMRIDRNDSGVPGLYGFNGASELLVSVTPSEVKTTVPATGGFVRMTGQDIEFSSGGTLTGENVFALKSHLEAWAPMDGTRAWVASESREYVRKGGRWSRVPIIESGTVAIAGAADETRNQTVLFTPGLFPATPDISLGLRTANPQNGTIAYSGTSTTGMTVHMRYLTRTTISVAWTATLS